MDKSKTSGCPSCGRDWGDHDGTIMQCAKLEIATSWLRDVVLQFAPVSDAGLRSTGGLSVLEGVFEFLGLSDPHQISKLEQCDEPRCKALATCGWPSGKRYRRTCGKHSKGMK